MLIYKTTNKIELYSDEEKKKIEELSGMATKEKLLNLVYELSELQNEIKTSSQKLIIFQAGLIKMCNKQTGNSTEDLERRISELEDKIKNGKVGIIQNNQARVGTTTQRVNYNTAGVNNPINSDNSNSAKTSTLSQGPIAKEWPNVLNELKSDGKIMLYTNLLNTSAVEVNDMTVGIQFPNGINAFGKTVLEKAENKVEIEKKVSIVSGKTMNVKYIDLKENNNQAQSNSVEDMMNGLDIPFNVID